MEWKVELARPMRNSRRTGVTAEELTVACKANWRVLKILLRLIVLNLDQVSRPIPVILLSSKEPERCQPKAQLAQPTLTGFTRHQRYTGKLVFVPLSYTKYHYPLSRSTTLPCAKFDPAHRTNHMLT